MNPLWIIETGIFEDSEAKFIEALRRTNTKYQLLPTTFHLDAYQGESEIYNYMSRGSIDFVTRAYHKFTPGAYCKWKHTECLFYYPRLVEFLLNKEASFVPFGLLQHHVSAFWLGDFFLRPNSGRKTFTGKVFKNENFHYEFNRWCYEKLEPEDIVLIAPAREMKREWRLVCLKDEVITGSQYRDRNNLLIADPAVPQDVYDFGNKVAAKWWSQQFLDRDPVYVIDIAEYEDELYLLEINAFSCSGLYKCDFDEIIVGVNQVVKEIEDNIL